MTTTTITRRYHFEAAHFLPGVREGHKCKRLHGHNYELEITVAGIRHPITGFIIDFWDLDKIVQPYIDLVDHRLLNDITGLENPTAEIIAEWFVAGLDDAVRKHDEDMRITKLRIYETKDCWADVAVM